MERFGARAVGFVRGDPDELFVTNTRKIAAAPIIAGGISSHSPKNPGTSKPSQAKAGHDRQEDRDAICR